MSLINPGTGDIRTPDLYPFSPSLQVNSAARFVQCILTGNVTILPPTNAVDGGTLEMRLVASGADRNLSFSGAIALCQNLADQPFLIEEGTTARVVLRYDLARNQWCIQGLIEQY